MFCGIACTASCDNHDIAEVVAVSRCFEAFPTATFAQNFLAVPQKPGLGFAARAKLWTGINHCNLREYIVYKYHIHHIINQQSYLVKERECTNHSLCNVFLGRKFQALHGLFHGSNLRLQVLHKQRDCREYVSIVFHSYNMLR